jgi:hypothetical protein
MRLTVGIIVADTNVGEIVTNAISRNLAGP